MISSSGAVQKSFDLKLEAKQTQSIDILILNDLHLHLATFKKLLSTVELQISEKKRSQRFLPNRNTYVICIIFYAIGVCANILTNTHAKLEINTVYHLFILKLL